MRLRSSSGVPKRDEGAKRLDLLGQNGGEGKDPNGCAGVDGGIQTDADVRSCGSYGFYVYGHGSVRPFLFYGFVEWFDCLNYKAFLQDCQSNRPIFHEIFQMFSIPSSIGGVFML